MTERDPLEILVATADRAEAPNPQFRSDLLDQLLADLDPVEGADASPLQVVEIDQPDSEGRHAWRRRGWPILAIAAAVIVLIVVLTVGGGDSDEENLQTTTPTAAPTAEPVSTPTAQPEPTATPEAEAQPEPTVAPTPVIEPLPAPLLPQPNLSVDLSRQLLDFLGGEAGLVVGEREETSDFSQASIDPRNSDRVLFGNQRVPQPPELWTFADGTASVELIEPDESRKAGQFARDGSMAVSGSGFDNNMYLYGNDGSPLGDLRAVGHLPSAYDSEGGRVVLLAAATPGCPFTSVTLLSGGQEIVLDDRDNAFGHVAIVQPGVVVGFPYSAGVSTVFELGTCDPLTETVTSVWDTTTGERIDDHPLAGRELVRAAVSGDGSRAIVMDPEGVISILDMGDGSLVRELGEADASNTQVPLALNHNGTIGAAAASDGTLLLWHVASGEQLLELRADVRTALLGRDVGVNLAYDASAVALLTDDDNARWRLVTLDPNDWLDAACAAGFELSADDRSANGIDPSVCG